MSCDCNFVSWCCGFQALSEVVWLEERPRAGAGLLAAGTKRPLPRPEAEEAEETEESGAEAEEERRLKLLKERVEWCGDGIKRKSGRVEGKLVKRRQDGLLLWIGRFGQVSRKITQTTKQL